MVSEALCAVAGDLISAVATKKKAKLGEPWRSLFVDDTDIAEDDKKDADEFHEAPGGEFELVPPNRGGMSPSRMKGKSRSIHKQGLHEKSDATCFDLSSWEDEEMAGSFISEAATSDGEEDDRQDNRQVIVPMPGSPTDLAQGHRRRSHGKVDKINPWGDEVNPRQTAR
eukprot:FR740618.1.p1 GENE.FR740618.1~~FR740618.1.p1  ORF type:complete len:169 (+),score=25.51 FR740618.1:3-509(+)